MAPDLLQVQEKIKDEQADLNIILGGLIGAVGAACVALLFSYVRKHPEKAMKVCQPSAFVSTCLSMNAHSIHLLICQSIHF